MSDTKIIEVRHLPAIVPFQIWKGDTLSDKIIRFVEDNANLDVSGDAFEFLLHDEDGNQINTPLTIGSGIEFVGDGIEWKFLPAVTATWAKDAIYTYALKWTRASNGVVKTIQAGNIIPRYF
mgnify:CR=1 FL=1